MDGWLGVVIMITLGVGFAGVMIGLSDRTNETGAQALAECLKALGKTSVIVRTPPNVLHFKSDCSLLDDETILLQSPIRQSPPRHMLT